MTSDATKTEPEVPVSDEQRKLDLVMKDYQIELKKLNPEELNHLLKDWFSKVDPTNLRGFRPLSQVLSARNSDDAWFVVDGETIELPADFVGEFDFKTHSIKLNHAFASMERCWKRHETGEETRDYNIVVKSWNNQAYLYSAELSTVVLRRSRDYSHGAQNLVHVSYHLQKVPYKNHFQIRNVSARNINLSNFSTMCSAFGCAAELATDMIKTMRDVMVRHHQSLVDQANAVDSQVKEWQRLGKAISMS